MNELDLSNTQAFIFYRDFDWLSHLPEPSRPQKKRPNRARKYTDDRNN